MQARALFDLNKAADAEAPLAEALRIWPVEYGRQSVEYAVTNAMLARAWFLQRKELDKIETIYQEAIATIAAIKPDTDNALQLIKGWWRDTTGKSKAH